ncbi:hypothetical protein [Pseudonocardia adelaidensis]
MTATFAHCQPASGFLMAARAQLMADAERWLAETSAELAAAGLA